MAGDVNKSHLNCWPHPNVIVTLNEMGEKVSEIEQRGASQGIHRLGSHEESVTHATCHLECIWMEGTGAIRLLVGFFSCPMRQLGSTLGTLAQPKWVRP